MSLVLGVDTETTGLDCTVDRITEIGAVLYDWNPGIPLRIFSVLVIPEKPIPEEVMKVNGITEAMIENYGVLEEDALRELSTLICEADYLMAHNAAFDRGLSTKPSYVGNDRTGKALALHPRGHQISGRDHHSETVLLGGGSGLC